MYLRFVKMIEGSKLYNTLILNQFNEIDPQDCYMADLLTELVIKVEAKFKVEILFHINDRGLLGYTYDSVLIILITGVKNVFSHFADLQ